MPRRRIVAFYERPDSAAMGILGQHDMDRLLHKLREQADAYAALDPSRPVLPALDLIALAAQPTPGNDGAYRARTAARLIDAYAAFKARHDVQLILDIQPGRADAAAEFDALRAWLE